MKRIPEKINKEWIGTLGDVDLLDVESRLHEKFAVLDRKHKLLRGSRYVLLQGPSDLIDAWDRWSRVDRAARARSLAPNRRVAGASERESGGARVIAPSMVTVRDTAKDPGER